MSVDSAGAVTGIPQDYLRAGLRKVDDAASRPGAPVLPCRTFEAVPVGESMRYRIPLVTKARRFKAGHPMRLYLTSDDQNPHSPAMLQFRHASVGTVALVRSGLYPGFCYRSQIGRIKRSANPLKKAV